MRIEDLEVFVATAQSEVFLTPNGEAHRFNSSAAKEILRLEEEFGSLLGSLTASKNNHVL